MRLPAILLFVAIGSGAHAFEATGNAVADAMLRAVETAGFADARADRVSRDGSSTVLTAVTAGEQNSSTFFAQSIRIDAGLVDADNTLIAEKIEYRRVSITTEDDGPASQMDRVTVAPARLVDQRTDARTASSLLGGFDRLTIERITARSTADETISAKHFQIEVGPTDGVVSGGIIAEDLTFSPALLDPLAKERLQGLGIQTLVMDLSADATWREAAGEGVLERGRISVDGIGALELSGSVLGLTRTLLERYRATANNLTATLNALGGVSIAAVTMTFEDQGLTDKLLARGAASARLTRAAYTDVVVETLAAALANLADEAFAERVITATRKFLGAPGRMTLASSPPKPVTALQVMTTAIVNPNLLPELLSIEIDAR
ncbi:MAG: hypothetical protein AAGB11_16095 [Pseudomonadota bacterium]